MLDDAGVDHLLHEVGRSIARLHVLLELHHLLLELVDLLEPGLVLLFLERRGLLISLDLGESTSPFAGDLEHVRRDALGDYKDKKG